MEALTIYNVKAPAAQEVQEITPALIESFVSFVDRTDATTKTYLCNLRQFIAWMRYKAIRRPVRADIITYRQWLLNEHNAIEFAPETFAGWKYRTDHSGEPVKIVCAASTVKLYLHSVKQFFKWTASNNYYPNIAENIHAPKVSTEHKKDGLTAGEVMEIENSITEKAETRLQESARSAKDTAGRIQRGTEQGKRLYAMFLLATNAGLRTVELSRANIKDYEIKGGRAWLYVWGKGHSGADQRKAIAPEVADAINDYLSSRTDARTGNSPLFVSTGNRSGGKRIASTTISTMLKRAMQAAGFDSARLTAHSLRHTTAMNVMEMTGNNVYTVQQYMRHTDPKTTEIYLENDNAAQDEMIAQQLYKKLHGEAEACGRNKLEQLIGRLNPQQLEQLAGIAEAMA